MDNEDYREKINSALFKLNADTVHDKIDIYLNTLQMAGATEEEIWKVTHLIEKENYSFDRVKTIRDQIINITKEYQEVPLGERSFREEATEKAKHQGNENVRKMWSMAKEIEFQNLNILMEDTAYILAGVKSLIVFNLNKLAKKYDVEKPIDVINAYGIDAWDNTEQN